MLASHAREDNGTGTLACILDGRTVWSPLVWLYSCHPYVDGCDSVVGHG